ncbi:uncharacterized protein MICPUCDRAFT_51907 [Micromonas pusilla CCMP1545]|jgi:hypothetical protein|uniref:Predicted protein n=1 Tax=Micromonas pusilla (strain CCMP1545) TaxID=564608 RepID=C1N2A2_MICPC|nr:uncharacterized protein MICPUCDRAFT_51907 [Micromonas pusilla CCMP1545]EEH53969.1 predicted protein [Micromonas pusilla CCMP1545]|eukprot:XP_003062257.1 predicted protein [Micromonas pusilla CCMP1545]
MSSAFALSARAPLAARRRATLTRGLPRRARVRVGVAPRAQAAAGDKSKPQWSTDRQLAKDEDIDLKDGEKLMCVSPRVFFHRRARVLSAAKVLKERRSPRGRGRMGTSVTRATRARRNDESPRRP